MAVRVFSIYTITNAVNGKAYVGFTGQVPLTRYRRHLSHRSGCKALRDALKKYGEKNFTFEVIYQSLDQEHTHRQMEPHFIEQYATFGPGGYNLTSGGDGTVGRKMTPEQKERLLKVITGRKPTALARQRMSEAHLRRPKGELHPNYGRTRSQQSIAKQIMSSVGKKRGEETRRKQAEAQRGEKGSGYGKRGERHHQAKRYRLERLDGSAAEFVGLAEFCRANPQYSAPMLSMMANGHRSAYKDIKSICIIQGHDLPVGSFSESGTNINTTVLTMWRAA